MLENEVVLLVRMVVRMDTRDMNVLLLLLLLLVKEREFFESEQNSLFNKKIKK